MEKQNSRRNPGPWWLYKVETLNLHDLPTNSDFTWEVNLFCSCCIQLISVKAAKTILTSIPPHSQFSVPTLVYLLHLNIYYDHNLYKYINSLFLVWLHRINILDKYQYNLIRQFWFQNHKLHFIYYYSHNRIEVLSIN